MQGKWSCYRGGHFNGVRMVTLQSGHFNGGKMVILQWWSLMEGEWLSYGGRQYSGGRMVMLQRWPVHWKEDGHVTEVVS